MPSIPFGLGAYRRDAGQFQETRLINQYAEMTEDKSVILIGRPGLSQEWDLGDPSQVYGMFTQPGCFSGDIFAATATQLYRAGVSVGAIATGARVSMAGSEIELLVATGSAMYRYDGSAISLVDFPDDAGENSAVYFSSQFVVARTGSEKFYWSAVLDGSSWDSLSFASAERKPDNLVGLAVVGDELWMFGENSVEFWQPTGALDAPFERVQGRVYNVGCCNRDNIHVVDNTAFWVGDDKVVYRGGPVPIRISNHGIEERLKKTPAEQIYAINFPWKGHLFYIVNTADGMFGVDVATQEWCEWRSYGRTGWRVATACVLGDDVFLGDDGTGIVWTLDDSVLVDGPDLIERISPATLKLNGKPYRLDNLIIDTSPGQISSPTFTPQVEMRRSRDGGHVWGPWVAASMGASGSYRTRPAWRRVGVIDEPGLMLEFRTTDPTPWTLAGVRANELLGSRGR